MLEVTQQNLSELCAMCQELKFALVEVMHHQNDFQEKFLELVSENVKELCAMCGELTALP